MFAELFSLLVSIGFAITGSLTFWPVQHGYDFYIPIILFIAAYVIIILSLFIIYDFLAMLTKKLWKSNKICKFARFLLSDGNRFICNHAHVFIKITGKENIPHERFLYVCNHMSKFDPMVVIAYLGKHDIAFVTKPSNMNIPIAKHIMPLLHFQPINRDDKLQSLSVMKNATDLISNNVCSVGIYPEGTRHSDGNMGEFHSGVFSIATASKCPIVVATIQGSNKIATNFPFKPTKVKLDIIGCIRSDEYDGKTTLMISEEIKTMMKNHLEEK